MLPLIRESLGLHGRRRKVLPALRHPALPSGKCLEGQSTPEEASLPGTHALRAHQGSALILPSCPPVTIIRTLSLAAPYPSPSLVAFIS